MNSLQASPVPSAKPIPFAVLKVQLKQLVQQYEERATDLGVITTRDLLPLIEDYEREHQVVLLTDPQKLAIRPYTRTAPDLEMTLDDILDLLKLVCAPSPVASVSAPTSKLYHMPRTSSPLVAHPQPTWKRRLSTTSLHTQVPGPSEAMDLCHKTSASDSVPNALSTTYEEDEGDEDVDQENDEFDQYYRRSLALTQRLKQSEQSLASMTRDNDDRILVLQNRVDEMTELVTKQKRELIEYKGKESNSLEQISMLEQHIANIEQSETDQKQVYLSIKTLFDEKCEETQKLQELLKQKEQDLQHTEVYLCHFRHEFMQLNKERDRLTSLQHDLVTELEASQHTHTELAEQRSENERLQQLIDSLRYDLDAARLEQQQQSPLGLHSTNPLILSLEAELEEQLQKKEDENAKIMVKVKQMEQTEQRLRSAESEKNYYKLQATEAKKDLDRVKDELLHLKRTLDADRQATPSPPASSSSSTASSQPNIWTLSRQRQRKMGQGKRREIMDLHESRSMAHQRSLSGTTPMVNNRLSRRLQTSDKVINSTATFALYTLLVYIFGIVTSTFLIDNGLPSGLEQALVAAASTQGGVKGKLFEMLLYWIEKLLFEGEAVLA
ncbi:hypothetical protein DM01DRAFT_1339493 [Hesseltinella vesiculosa]|uniref:Uncharacterized protein n=1 Tax=Hesseltinella vesiculosa TaxID=101127 RepID=A0A1X2G6R4_9FUNG|nr:hypothetical protein DM01DRAFT_1339493 [Hesseltinella vesiculosa]